MVQMFNIVNHFLMINKFKKRSNEILCFLVRTFCSLMQELVTFAVCKWCTNEGFVCMYKENIFILHDNNAKVINKLQKKVSLIIRWSILFILNEFINFFNFILRFRIFLKILKNERNLTNFEYVFVTRFHITHKNFPNDRDNNCTVIASIFCKYGIFINVKKLKKFMWMMKKIYKLICNIKKDSVSDYLLNNFFLTSLLIIFRHYHANLMFLRFFMVIFLSDFYCIAKYWNSNRIKLLVGNVHP